MCIIHIGSIWTGMNVSYIDVGMDSKQNYTGLLGELAYLIIYTNIIC